MAPETLALLAGLALVDATSIGTLVIPLWLLTAPGRLRSRVLVVYLATVAGCYLVLGLLLLAGLDVAGTVIGPALDLAWVRWIQLGLGVALFALAFSDRRLAAGADRALAWRDRLTGGEPPPVRSVVLVALAAVAIEAATMLPYLAALGVLTASDLTVVSSALILVAYCGVMVLPAVLLMALRVALHRHVSGLLTRLDGWLQRAAVESTGWIVGIAGFLVAGDAVGALGLG